MKVIRAGFGGHKAPSIGLVLGAGGVVGQAYQAGVLAALQRETGWDPRAASVIVGTSAGSVTGAALRVGVPATDLAASLYGMPTSRRGGAILERILPADAGPLPSPSVRSLLRPWNLPSPALLTRVARRPLAFRPQVAAVTLLPRGQVDISERAAASTSSSATAGRTACGSARSGGPTAPASSSAVTAHPGPAWPRRCWPPAPSPATSGPSPSRAPSTSTAVCTRSPTPTCCAPTAWTWS